MLRFFKSNALIDNLIKIIVIYYSIYLNCVIDNTNVGHLLILKSDY